MLRYIIYKIILIVIPLGDDLFCSCELCSFWVQSFKAWQSFLYISRYYPIHYSYNARELLFCYYYTKIHHSTKRRVLNNTMPNLHTKGKSGRLCQRRNQHPNNQIKWSELENLMLSSICCTWWKHTNRAERNRFSWNQSIDITKIQSDFPKCSYIKSNSTGKIGSKYRQTYTS